MTTATDKIYSTDGLYDAQRLVLAQVTPGERVLELGPGSGHVTRALAAQGCRVSCIEFSPGAAQLASPAAEHMVVGDLEDAGTWERLGDARFDTVIAGDVLEHLRDSGVALRQAKARLAPKGRVIVSVPNVAHWTVRSSLARGKFEYEDFGILDEQHVRFFTLATLRELVGQCGFGIVRTQFSRGRFPAERLFERRGLRRVKSVIDARLLSSWPQLFAYQIIMTLESEPG